MEILLKYIGSTIDVIGCKLPSVAMYGLRPIYGGYILEIQWKHIGNKIEEYFKVQLELQIKMP